MPKGRRSAPCCVSTATRLIMASSTSPFFMNLTDALNSRSATPSHMQHSNPLRGARHTRATAPSSASGSHCSNSVNSAPSASLSQNQTHVNACNDRLPPRSLEALLQLSSNISQPPQIAVTIGTQEDDHLLVRILYESDDNGQTYRQALESLNGVCPTFSAPDNVMMSHTLLLDQWTYRSTMERLFS